MTFGKDQDPRLNSKYSDELAHVMVERIIEGVSVKNICKELGISVVTFFDWRRNNPTFRSLYDRAREDQVRTMVDEIIEIADDSENDTQVTKNGDVKANNEWIQRSRLRIESRKWLASVFAPKDFAPSNGEKDATVRVIVENDIKD